MPDSPLLELPGAHSSAGCSQDAGCGTAQPMENSSHCRSAALQSTVGLCAKVPTTSPAKAKGPAGPVRDSARIIRDMGLQ